MLGQMKHVRRYWLERLIADHCGGDRKRLMEATGLSKGRVSQLLKDGFSDVTVRNLLGALAEDGINLPADYFDRPIPLDAVIESPSVGFAPAHVLTVGEPVAQYQAARQVLARAFQEFAEALAKLPPDKRNRVLASTAAYAGDMTELGELEYVLRALSGESSEGEPKRKKSNGE